MLPAQQSRPAPGGLRSWLTIGQRNGPFCFELTKHFHNHFPIVLAGWIIAAVRGFLMPSRAIATVSIRNALGRFRRNRCGSTAVEFALIAPIFFGLLFAIVETGMMFFAGQVLETGTQDAARQMFTHQLQGSGLSLAQQQSQFQTDLCNRVSTLFNCIADPTVLVVDVRSYPPGTVINLTDPIVGGDIPGPFVFQPPPAGSVNTVVVRVFNKYQLYVTGLGYNVSNLNNSQRLLSSTAAFHVEP
jgi:Flp pilus assembly protein TadG